MIELRQLVFGIVCGGVLILLGLVPGLFQQLTSGTQNAISQFSSGLGRPPVRYSDAGARQPVWLAVTGAALIAAVIAAYVS